MSRHHQEAGFVDLLTKMPGAKDDPAGEIIQKTLDGTITEKDAWAGRRQ